MVGGGAAGLIDQTGGVSTGLGFSSRWWWTGVDFWLLVATVLMMVGLAMVCTLGATVLPLHSGSTNSVSYSLLFTVGTRIVAEPTGA